MTLRKWTEAELDLLRSAADRKLSSGQIAKKVNRSRNAVCAQAHRMGIELKSDAGIASQTGRAIKAEIAQTQQNLDPHRPGLALRKFSWEAQA